MASGVLRGSGLGSHNNQDPAGVELAPRLNVGFDCPNEHRFSVVFAEEAELPPQGECPKCGATSARSDGVESDAKPEKPPRTHWDMLRERRSIEELEDLLAERLDEIRDSGGG